MNFFEIPLKETESDVKEEKHLTKLLNVSNKLPVGLVENNRYDNIDDLSVLRSD